MNDTTVYAYDTVRLYVKPVFAPDSILFYVWSFNSAPMSFDTTTVPFVEHVWTIGDSGLQCFSVKIADAHHGFSDSATTRITVLLCRPGIVLSGNSMVFANDSNRYFISTSGPCAAKWYLWSFNNGISFTDTTFIPSFLKRWSESDTGVHRIVACAQTQSGIASFPDTLPVKVVSCRPTVHLSGVTEAFVEDSSRYFISDSGPCPTKWYLWSFNNGIYFTDTTFSPTLLKRWSESDTDVHLIVACAQTQSGVISFPDTLPVKVLSCKMTVRLSGDSMVFADDSDRYFISTSGLCPAKWYLWSFNNGKSFTDTTINPTLLKRWNESDTAVHSIVVCAQTQTGIVSFPDTLPIKVISCMPTVHLGGVSEVLPLDTTRLIANGISNCGPLVIYMWSFNGGVSFKDTVSSNFFVKQWGLVDTGLCHVWVKALSSTGLVSLADSLTVHIRSDILPVQLPRDTTIRANDTIAIVARIMSRESSISRFFWTIDHAAQEVPTIGNMLRWLWPPQAAGVHILKVRATDDRMTGSIIDSMAITVVAQTPTLIHPHDTIASRTDTILVTLQASEAGAQIVIYLWNIGGLTWTDSGKTPQHKIYYSGKDTVTIGVGVRDNRGMVSIDSFHIYYNAPPVNIRMLSPANGDTVRYRTIDSTFAQKRVAFRFSAFDPNGTSDSLLFSLYLGKSSGQLAKIYEGRDSIFIAGAIDTAQYLWRLVAHDKFGDSASCTGTFITLLQQTICFAGHSIIVGYAGDGTTGGFRKKVLSAMRSLTGCAARVKPMGPLVTNYLTPSFDDSCFAVNSYTAKELWLLMSSSFPSLNADMWVIMLGVNGGYYSTELNYLMFLLNQVHNNNSKAGMYVINGLPYTPSYGQDKIFNSWLSDSITAKKKLNWNIYAIDAFTKFAINDTPNPALFAPELPALLHPNQVGYDTLANLILTTMGIKKP